MVRGLVLGGVFWSTALHAQQTGARKWVDSARTALEPAASHGDTAALKSIQSTLERALTAFPDDPWLQHYLAYTIYRQASARTGQGATNLGPLWQTIDSLLERSLTKLKLAESHALRGAALGQMIGVDPSRAMLLGPLSDQEITTAVTMSPNNPRVLIMKGIGEMFTPPEYGGGVDKAEATLKRAVSVVAADTVMAPAPMWGHAEAYAWLGIVYQKEGKNELARGAFQKALALDPEYNWVKYSLLPSIKP